MKTTFRLVGWPGWGVVVGSWAWVGMTLAGEVDQVKDSQEERAIIQLTDASWQVREQAIVMLQQVGGRASEPHLIRMLKDPNARVRLTTVSVMGRKGPIEFLEPLASLFRDPDPKVQRQTVYSVRRFGARAIPWLRQAVRDGGYISGLAAEQLGEMKAVEAAPEVITLLAHKEWLVRGSAVLALGNMGPDVIPQLQEALQHEKPEARLAAVQALTLIGRSALPALIQALRHDDPAVRLVALQGVVTCGAIEALPFIQRCAKEDADASIREEARQVLIQLGADPSGSFKPRPQ